MSTSLHKICALGVVALLGCATTNTPTAPDPGGVSEADMLDKIAPDPPPERELLTPEAAGAFTVTGTIEAFDEEAGFGEEILGEGVMALAVAIPDVCAIQVLSPRYVTAQGLSVNSTAGEWKAALGELTYNGDTGLYEPGAGASGYGLILDTEAEPPEEDADVVAIRIGACPI